MYNCAIILLYEWNLSLQRYVYESNQFYVVSYSNNGKYDNIKCRRIASTNYKNSEEKQIQGACTHTIFLGKKKDILFLMLFHYFSPKKMLHKSLQWNILQTMHFSLWRSSTVFFYGSCLFKNFKNFVKMQHTLGMFFFSGACYKSL